MTTEQTEAPVRRVSEQRTVTLHEGAVDVLKDMLAHVQTTAQEQINSATTYEELARNQREVIEQQWSLLTTLVSRLTGGANNYDGDLHIFPDSAPLSLFWRHEKSGYHGGLIFHQPYNGQKVGRWSVHT